MTIRDYQPEDYEALVTLYKSSSLYGGQFDEARDSERRIHSKVLTDPHAVLIAETDGNIIGTVSLIDDGRVAWLFRFAVLDNNDDVARALYEKACGIFRSRGHTQVVVYGASDNAALGSRYHNLGMTEGGKYTAFWQNI